jgi:hypothetical protein
MFFEKAKQMTRVKDWFWRNIIQKKYPNAAILVAFHLTVCTGPEWINDFFLKEATSKVISEKLELGTEYLTRYYYRSPTPPSSYAEPVVHQTSPSSSVGSAVPQYVYSGYHAEPRGEPPVAPNSGNMQCVTAEWKDTFSLNFWDFIVFQSFITPAMLKDRRGIKQFFAIHTSRNMSHIYHDFNKIGVTMIILQTISEALIRHTPAQVVQIENNVLDFVSGAKNVHDIFDRSAEYSNTVMKVFEFGEFDAEFKATLHSNLCSALFNEKEVVGTHTTQRQQTIIQLAEACKTHMNGKCFVLPLICEGVRACIEEVCLKMSGELKCFEKREDWNMFGFGKVDEIDGSSWTIEDGHFPAKGKVPRRKYEEQKFHALTLKVSPAQRPSEDCVVGLQKWLQRNSSHSKCIQDLATGNLYATILFIVPKSMRVLKDFVTKQKYFAEGLLAIQINESFGTEWVHEYLSKEAEEPKTTRLVLEKLPRDTKDLNIYYNADKLPIYSVPNISEIFGSSSTKYGEHTEKSREEAREPSVDMTELPSEEGGEYLEGKMWEFHPQNAEDFFQGIASDPLVPGYEGYLSGIATDPLVPERDTWDEADLFSGTPYGM